jgi:hypothetical protein
MSTRKGIAEDASEYEDLVSDDGGRDEGIAEDSALFEGLVEESESGRSLESNWLYQLDGHVFGPVKPKEILRMLYEGEIGPDTPIAVEEEEFQSLRRFGVFRAHLPKVDAHRKEVEENRQKDRVDTKKRIIRRIGFIAVAAMALVGISYGLIRYIRKSKEEQAAREKQEKEDALERELEDLFASVTIEPPLMPLVDEPEEKQPEGSKKGKRRRRGARAVASFGTGELQREEIMAGVASVFGGFKRCIVEQMQREPESVPEQIVLTFFIQNDGRATDVGLTDRILRKSELRGCLAAQLARAQWRPFKGEVQNVEYPITIGRR